MLYASEHPEVYVFTRNPAAASVGAAPNDVLLLADNAPVPGFNYTGSLYAGSGYWSSGPELPFPWSDQDVSTLLRLYSFMCHSGISGCVLFECKRSVTRGAEAQAGRQHSYF